MLLLSRWPLFMEDPRRLQGLLVRSKANKVMDDMEAASLVVVEQF